MLILDKKDAKLRIRVANTNKEDVFSIKLDIDDHAWAELFAWGDGRDYALGVEQTKKYRLVKHD